MSQFAPNVFPNSNNPLKTNTCCNKSCRSLGWPGISSLILLFWVTTGLAATENRDYWFQQGELSLAKALATTANTNRAKNIILFIGDGNGVTSVTATRIFDGQSRGLTGEENSLAYEHFPHVALIKTYNTNQQVPDSAGTMTAIMTGVKTRAGLIGMDQSLEVGQCQNIEEHSLPTLLEQLASQGKATGIISTARITHATPAATYAHSPSRDWEADTDIPFLQRKSTCPDIARQLVEFDKGSGLQIILGGGRQNFLTRKQADPEYPEITGKRKDTNLIEVWQQRHPKGTFIWNNRQFVALENTRIKKEPVLGLFEPSHMQFEADRPEDPAGEPSLSEMVKFAIERLQTDDDGFFLMVEGGRIDHAHHGGNAYRALKDGQAFSKAVETALAMVNVEETLVIVTADHSHVLTMAGYPTRGNPILGKVIGNDQKGNPKKTPALAEDGKPYTTLGYQNGTPLEQTNHRDLSKVNTEAPDYRQEFAIATGAETHGGEDVAAYAIGPWSHLIQGVQEQNYIYHVMRHAAQ